MKRKSPKEAIPVRAVAYPTNAPNQAHRQHPCAHMSEEERRRGIVDILSQALIQLKRKRSTMER